MAEHINFDDLFNLKTNGAEANLLLLQSLTALRQAPGMRASETASIADGILTPSGAYVVVDTEGGAPADDLLLIATTNTNDGMEIKLISSDSRTITVVHMPEAVNGISLAGGVNVVLSRTKFLHLKRFGDRWREITTGSAGIDVATDVKRGIGRSATVQEAEDGETGTNGPAWITPEQLREYGSGLPLFSLLPCPTGVIREGYLFPHVDNGLLTRAAFPEAYDQLVLDLAAGSTAILDNDAAWQAERTANGGVCGKFMLDAATETFRIPFTPGLYYRDADPVNGITAGVYQIDTMRPITAKFTVRDITGVTTLSGIQEGAAARGDESYSNQQVGVATGNTSYSQVINSALLGPHYSGSETRPKTAVCPVMIKMYGAVTEAGTANIAALIQLAAGKLDAATFAVSQQIMHVQDQKPSGTQGGAFTAGAWRTRDLNTVVVNTIPGASLANNQVMLPEGRYEIEAFSPAFSVNGNVARLYDVTDNISLMFGNTAFTTASGSYATSLSVVFGLIQLTKPTTIELQHICKTTGSNGFGERTGLGGATEVYAQIKIRRLS